MVRNLEQPRIDGALLAQSRTLRITAEAVRTHLAIAVFALLDARAAARLTLEQSRKLSASTAVRQQGPVPQGEIDAAGG
jgi:hypothetical protein